MDDYERTVVTTSTGWQTDAAKSQDNYCLADIYIKDFASLCSLSSIQGKMDGLANRPSAVVAKTTETVLVQAAAPPVVLVAPTVVRASAIPGAPVNATPLPTTNYEIK